MPRVFICYRRDDAPASAGRLFDRLRERFGRDQVFMDVDTIRPGEDFAARIDGFVGSCDSLIAVVGPDWLGERGDGSRRIDEPGDYVRLELESAVARDVQVLPALVEGGTMPRPDELPPSLAAFANRQAVEVSQTRFDHDAGRLAAAIAGEDEAPPRGRWRRPLVWAGAAAVLAAGAVALVVALGGGGSSSSGDEGDPSLDVGRRAILTAYENWQDERLWTLEPQQISAAAKRALLDMPIDPIVPLPPAPADCSGEPDDVGCVASYPGQSFSLQFNALRYPSGMRVVAVRCFDNRTGDNIVGGIETCAQYVRAS